MIEGRIPPYVLLLLIGVLQGTTVWAQSPFFAEGRGLQARWELEDSLRRGNFLLSAYKPVYVLPAVWSSDPNREPHRTADPPPTGDDQLALDVVECKFRFSIKTKVVQGLYKKRGDPWVAYTQSSRWQVYNHGLSRTQRIGILADGKGVATAKSLKEALQAEVAMVKVLSPVHDADADLALMTTTSVVYAAIAVIDKQPWVDIPDAQDFVREAFRHCKAIAMLGDAATLFDASENEGCAESTQSPQWQRKQEADEGLYPYHCSTPPLGALTGSGHGRERLSQQFVRPER